MWTFLIFYYNFHSLKRDGFLESMLPDARYLWTSRWTAKSARHVVCTYRLLPEDYESCDWKRGTSLNSTHNQGIYIPNLQYNVHCVNLKYLIEVAAKKIEVFFIFHSFLRTWRGVCQLMNSLHVKCNWVHKGSPLQHEHASFLVLGRFVIFVFKNNFNSFLCHFIGGWEGDYECGFRMKS